jgi:hypothetical protein
MLSSDKGLGISYMSFGNILLIMHLHCPVQRKSMSPHSQLQTQSPSICTRPHILWLTLHFSFGNYQVWFLVSKPAVLIEISVIFRQFVLENTRSVVIFHAVCNLVYSVEKVSFSKLKMTVCLWWSSKFWMALSETDTWPSNFQMFSLLTELNSCHM